MVKRVFEKMEDPEFGEVGLMPTWMTDVNISNGRGCAHDMIEHLFDDEGGAEGEMIAVGASLWIRGNSGSLGNVFNRDLTDSLSSDVYFVLSNIFRGGNSQTMKAPTRSRALREEDDINDVITSGVQKGFSSYLEHECYDEQDEIEFNKVRHEYERNAINWIRVGYSRARTFFQTRRGYSYCDVDWFFQKLAEDIDKKDKHIQEGEKLEVSLNFTKLQYKLNHLTFEDLDPYYGQ